jgi:hypothetical protein
MSKRYYYLIRFKDKSTDSIRRPRRIFTFWPELSKAILRSTGECIAWLGCRFAAEIILNAKVTKS